MLKVILLAFAYFTVGQLFWQHTAFAAQSRILSQDVQVNYATPKRVGSTRVSRQGGVSNQTPKVSNDANQQVQFPRAQTPLAPVSSARKVNIIEIQQTTNIVEPSKPAQDKKNIVMAHANVYALSPYAKYLRLGSIPPAFPLGGTMPWSYAIERASLKYSLSPELIAAVIKAESNFNAHVVSSKGAEGLMQIMPATQDYLDLQDPFNPESNIMAGSAYLREQLDKFGSIELALAAYNAGPGNVLKYNGIPPFNETQNYVIKVLKYKENYSRPAH